MYNFATVPTYDPPKKVLSITGFWILGASFSSTWLIKILTTTSNTCSETGKNVSAYVSGCGELKPKGPDMSMVVFRYPS